MPVTYPSEQRQQLVEELLHLLNATTLPTLRGIARQWGWPVRGTAKADVIDQIGGCLADAPRMAAAVRQLSDEERDTMAWLSALRLTTSPEKALQVALEQSSGRKLTQRAVGEILQRLAERGLAFFNQYRGYQVPGLYREWLPAPAAPRLIYQGASQPPAAAEFNLAILNQHVQHLLSAIAADRPAAMAQAVPNQYPPTRSSSNIIASAPGLVNAETLIRWGYVTAGEQHLARFLLEQMATGGLVKVEPASAGSRLSLVADAIRAWEELTAVARLNRLREWCVLAFQQPGLRVAGTWSEIDLALQDLQTYQLRIAYYYASAEQLRRQLAILRAWLLGLLQCLTPGAWLGIEQLAALIYHLQRDLLSWDSNPPSWRWHRGDLLLDPQQMDFDAWMGTYGRLIVAILTGPGTWLGFVQVSYADGKPVAFRYEEQVEVGARADIPPDALRFPAADVAVLRNSWQTGELRQLIRRVALETGRTAAATTYRLDAAAFRRTLQDGVSASQIAAIFAAGGFPLPAATEELLQAWQDRAGQHHLYDNLAVIEFNADIHPEEMRVITGSAAGRFYPVSPRCLVILDPDAIPALVDDLRRRGYTPRVLP